MGPKRIQRYIAESTVWCVLRRKDLDELREITPYVQVIKEGYKYMVVRVDGQGRTP